VAKKRRIQRLILKVEKICGTFSSNYKIKLNDYKFN